MRKGVVAGLSGLACVVAMSCGEEEENPTLELPDSVTSATTAVALRITGPYGPNDDYVVTSLAQMLNDNISFADFVTRGGLGDGPLAANVAGSGPEQIKAFIDNGGALGADVAVDSCGNPMVAAYVTPNMLQSILPEGTNIPGLSVWPGSCSDDVNCNTTKQGKWEVGFSKDHGDGARDLILTLSPTAGPQTIPAFQGHLITYMLTGNTTGNHLIAAPLYGNIRSITISAFGLVKFVKAGVSTRPGAALPGLPTRVWAFPAEARQLAGADLIVGVQPYEFCERSWAENMQGAEPFGCDQIKALVLDANSALTRQLIAERTDNGDDAEGVAALSADLDDLGKAFDYQLKAQIACPDVSEPNWIRKDIALGSVEIFQCPDGDVDRCIAYHDMEDYWCEVPASETATELEALLPHWEGGSVDYPGNFVADVPAGTRQTVTYAINGVESTIDWTLAYTQGSGAAKTNDEIVAHLNARMTALGQNSIVLKVVDEKIEVEPLIDLGPTGTFAWTSTGTLNSRFGFTGQATTTTPTMPAAKEKPYEITALNTEDPSAFDEVAYVKVSGTAAEPVHVYADEPERILGLFDMAGTEIALPVARLDGHCEADGAVVFEITTDAYLQLDLLTDGEDKIRLFASQVPNYL